MSGLFWRRLSRRGVLSGEMEDGDKPGFIETEGMGPAPLSPSLGPGKIFGRWSAGGNVSQGKGRR